MKMSQLFKSSRNWTQKAVARDKDGTEVDDSDESAVCWCLIGAFQKCYGEAGNCGEVFYLLSRELEGAGGIVRWNNDPARTFAEVKALVKKLKI